MQLETRLTSPPRLIIAAAMFAAALPFPDIGPELFRLELGGFTLAIRWYALAYIAGLLIGYRITLAAVRRPKLWGMYQPPMQDAQVESLLTWIILGVILGGRLGFVMFYQPAYYLSNPLEILKVWQGGMSFHGGFLGVVVATYLFSRQNDVRLGSVADLMALSVTPGLLLGRLSNFINAELWGRPTDVPWGVIFPGDAAQFCPEVVGACARHPSQLYEAGLEGLILGLILFWLAFGRGALARPWVISGVFFAGYGLSRFIVELVRQPDAQFVSAGNPVGYALQLGEWGLTMGQILSLPMIAVGLGLVIWRGRVT